MSSANGVPKEQAPSIEVNSLFYAFQDGSSGLQNVTLSLPPGSRTLLIGGTYSLHLLFYKFADIIKLTVPAKPPSFASSPANA